MFCMDVKLITDFDKVLPVAGIELAATAAAIRYPDRDDLVLVRMAQGTTTAAVFTQNAFCAAPVVIARAHLAATRPACLLINAGNANAGTGEQGEANAMACCKAVAEALGCEVKAVLPFSTGVIGEDLPVAAFERAMPELVAGLSENNWRSAARAILTTDTRPKLASCTLDINGKTVTITGMAKGSGMIRPNMATLLAYVATDARIDTSLLDTCLKTAVDSSFNRITVDGDTSTNDACVLLASGQSGVHIGNAEHGVFQAALDKLCEYLARALVLDGEGATKLINVRVEGGRDAAECEQVAYTVAHSPLVKTAFFASDPNWGRILAAVGRSGLPDLDINAIKIYLDDVCIVSNGARDAHYREEHGQEVMNRPEITIRIVLQRGPANLTVWTCDFSCAYVKINAEYRS